jgi:hypothetical protein
VLVSAPVALGEGRNASATPAPSATAASTQTKAAVSDVPDPKPLAEREQWEYELTFADGEVRVTAAVLRTVERPVVTARHVGRFANELWIGRELIDRVRFDFPLLGAEVPTAERQAIHEAPRFEPGLHAVRKVLIPNSPRAVRAQLVDRATGETTVLPWPPNAPLDPSIPGAETDAGQGGAAPIPE